MVLVTGWDSGLKERFGLRKPEAKRAASNTSAGPQPRAGPMLCYPHPVYSPTLVQCSEAPLPTASSIKSTEWEVGKKIAGIEAEGPSLSYLLKAVAESRVSPLDAPSLPSPDSEGRAGPFNDPEVAVARLATHYLTCSQFQVVQFLEPYRELWNLRLNPLSETPE